MVDHKVLLVNPPRINGIPWTREGRCQEKGDVLGTVKAPLSLLLLAALLREKGIDFRLIDATALDINTEEICRRLHEGRFHPDIIICCTTTATISADISSLSVAKKRFKARLVAFGAHISCVPVETLARLPEIDIGIIGEPEMTVLDLLSQEDLSTLADIKGIVWRDGSEIRMNEKREWIEDLDLLPMPAWDLVSLDNYVLPFTDEKYVLVETSRGCPFGCQFCVTQQNHGLKFRERRPEAVVDEIEALRTRFNLKYFNLFGDTVTFNKKFINAFCDEVVNRGLDIRWFANTRADTLHDINLVRKMKASGCWMLSIGIESVSEQTRNNMHKKLETDKIKGAVLLLREGGIQSFGFFIFGYPGETERDLYATARFARSLPLDYANFYPAVPYPGTGFYEECVKNSCLVKNDWDKLEYSYYVLETGELNQDIVKKAISHAYRRFYLRPQFVLRHLTNIGPLNFVAGSAKYGLMFLRKTFFPQHRLEKRS